MQSVRNIGYFKVISYFARITLVYCLFELNFNRI